MAEKGGAPHDDYFSAENVSATSSAFSLRGGKYGVLVEADFTGGGSVILQGKAASGTYVTVLTAFTADGYGTVDLMPGTYIITVSGTIAAGYVAVGPIPIRSRL